MSAEPTILSVGGSLIVPDKIDVDFLKAFEALLRRQIGQDRRFVLVCGGGTTAREYPRAGRAFTDDCALLDELGIEATLMNARLLKTIFADYAHPSIIRDPTGQIRFEQRILIAAGWKPGFSTDYDAILLGQNLGIRKIANLTNVDHAYSKNPHTYSDAEPLTSVSWEKFIGLLPATWTPGLHTPFDPVAAKAAQKIGLEVAILNGKNLRNLEDYVEGRPYVGTTIS